MPMTEHKTVLLIDDDADFRASIASVLEREGYRVIEAGTGTDGLFKLKQCEPDVIVLDIMLETVEEGYKVNEAIKLQEEYERFRDIPILMVSSIMDAPYERYAAQAEAVDIQPDRYFTKPLDMPRFLEALSTIAPKKRRDRPSP
jgi:CheY-like chemotaxis protein